MFYVLSKYIPDFEIKNTPHEFSIKKDNNTVFNSGKIKKIVNNENNIPSESFSIISDTRKYTKIEIKDGNQCYLIQDRRGKKCIVIKPGNKNEVRINGPEENTTIAIHREKSNMECMSDMLNSILECFKFIRMIDNTSRVISSLFEKKKTPPPPPPEFHDA